MPELKYEIVKHIGALSTSPSGWTKELNLISWNDRAPKYDIRDWAPDRAKMGKGVTVSADEVILLRDIEGYSYEEIAEMLTLEIGTVKSRINRARKQLRNFLVKSGNF